METTFHLEDELATMAAHINAATARWLELALSCRRAGGAAGDDFASWLAFRCGISKREAREYVRVGEALEELPATSAAFHRGELTFTKLRSLTRVATPASEEALLDLASFLTASQLERALRAYRRITTQDARDTHELEYVDYYWDDDGSLVLRARLASEDGTILVRALEAAREQVWERRRNEQCLHERCPDGQSRNEQCPKQTSEDFEPPRAPNVDAFVEMAQRALARERAHPDRARLVVHVAAAALSADDPGRCELEHGPVISTETARRLGCDAEAVSVIERDGLPLSVGRKRRTVPPALRRVLEARDGCCRWPGCTRRCHLQAHHLRHWAEGGETSLENLVLLCWQHHRLVHEGGYTVEEAADGELRFRNRHGLLAPSIPRSPPVGRAGALVYHNEVAGLTIDAKTNRNGHGDRVDLGYAVDAIAYISARAAS